MFRAYRCLPRCVSAAQLQTYLNAISQGMLQQGIMQQAAHLQAQQQVAQQQSEAEDCRQASPAGGEQASSGWSWQDAAARADQRTPVSEHGVTDGTADAADALKRNGPNSGGGEAKAEIPVGSSAHSLYNSYGYNPWSAYPSQGQFGSAGGGKAVDTKEAILEKELQHLRGQVSDKTKEVERLSAELEKSRQAIDFLKSQNATLKQGLSLMATQSHGSHGGGGGGGGQNGAPLQPPQGHDDVNSG